MAVQHSSLTGADLHEPKGVATATVGTVYVANGASSGTWTSVPATSVSVVDANGYFTGTNVEDVLTELHESDRHMTGVFADISTPSTLLVPTIHGCVVEQIDFILAGAITTADATVTVTRSDGAAMGSQVIAFSGSAEGTRFSLVPSGNNTFTDGVHFYVKLVTDGASSTAMPCYVLVHLVKT